MSDSLVSWLWVRGVAQEQEDEELTPEERKERKIMKLLLKVRPPAHRFLCPAATAALEADLCSGLKAKPCLSGVGFQASQLHMAFMAMSEWTTPVGDGSPTGVIWLTLVV